MRMTRTEVTSRYKRSLATRQFETLERSEWHRWIIRVEAQHVGRILDANDDFHNLRPDEPLDPTSGCTPDRLKPMRRGASSHANLCYWWAVGTGRVIGCAVTTSSKTERPAASAVCWVLISSTLPAPKGMKVRSHRMVKVTARAA